MNMKYFKITFFIGFLSLVFLPIASFAQVVSFSSSDKNYSVGDTFLVKILLDTKGTQINSIEGTLSIPQNTFNIESVETENSIISLWVEKPNIDERTGEIHFSGGLPGGYSGSSATIFSFVLKAKKEGNGNVDFKNINILLNDGKGTSVPQIYFSPMYLSIGKANSSVHKEYVASHDVTPPENFEPTISNNSSISGGESFVSFYAVDKGSGVDSYEVREKPWFLSLFGFNSYWKGKENLKVLSYQYWISDVKVRAIDVEGNYTEESLIKYPNTLGGGAVSILFIGFLYFCFVIFRKRSKIVGNE